MSNPISAAFDPIFMIHHTNVDRQLALWQALHPETWISQRNEPQYVNRDLTPFWKSSNAYFRSTDAPVKEFTKFNATYPEFVGLEGLSAAERKTRIEAKVNALYDPSNRRRGIAATAAAISGTAAAVAAEARQAPIALAAVSSQAAAVTTSARAAHAHAAPAHGKGPEALTALQRLDWFIRIRVKKFQLKQSFSVLFFLGSVPEDVSKWRSSPHLVGNHAEFVNSDPEHCVNCQESADVISEGFVDLDASLERLGYGRKTEEQIEKFIHDEIRWRIQKADGTVVPASELDVLEVAVLTWDVTDGDLDVRPVHRNLTSHKDGGRVPGHKRYHL
jgi:tyrosinase